MTTFFFSLYGDLRDLHSFPTRRSSDLLYSSRISLRGRSAASLRQNCVTVFSFSKNHFSSPSGRWAIVLLISIWGSTLILITVYTTAPKGTRSEERFSRNAETDHICRVL